MAATIRTDAPEALAWRTDNCTVIRAVEIFGDRWSFVLLREVFLGVRRFADIQDHTAIPRQVLSTRLDRLVEQGLLRRVPYQEPGQRVRDEYRLTETGFDLYPVLVAMADWGNRYVADRRGRRSSSCTRAATTRCTRRCGAMPGTTSRARATSWSARGRRARRRRRLGALVATVEHAARERRGCRRGAAGSACRCGGTAACPSRAAAGTTVRVRSSTSPSARKSLMRRPPST